MKMRILQRHPGDSSSLAWAGALAAAFHGVPGGKDAGNPHTSSEKHQQSQNICVRS